MTPEEQHQRLWLTQQLRDWAEDCVVQWMRHGEVRRPGDDDEIPARVNWTGGEPPEFTVGKQPYDDDFGRFRLHVRIEDLGPVSPIGPENDPAQCEEEPFVWALCTWADVRQNDVVRLPGTDSEAHVESCYHSADWHVHPAADPYHPERMPATWREVRVNLIDGTAKRIGPLSMAPDDAIEIRVTQSEINAIELLGGWSERVGIIKAEEGR